jgi:WD40 repeat protein
MPSIFYWQQENDSGIIAGLDTSSGSELWRRQSKGPISLSPDGNRLVILDEDNQARLIDTDTGDFVGESLGNGPKGFDLGIMATWSPNSEFLVVSPGMFGGLTCTLWTSEGMKLPMDMPSFASHVAISPSSKYIALFSDHAMSVVRVDTNTEVQRDQYEDWMIATTRRILDNSNELRTANAIEYLGAIQRIRRKQSETH